MKTSTAWIAVGAAAAAAQSINDLPPCGTCISNMLAIAHADFGCQDGDAACYCNNPNFAYGIRNCAIGACSEDDAAKTIAYSLSSCQGIGM